MTAIPTSPTHGDVLIARDHDGNGYTISVAPGPPQVRYPTYEPAVSVASEWAVQRRVTIWFTDDGATFTAMEPALPATPSGRGRRHARTNR